MKMGSRWYSEEQVNKMVLNKGNAKPSKYHNVLTEIDDIKFPSKKEAKRYTELKALQHNKDVKFFLMQVPFLLPAGIKYRLDFMVFWSNGNITYEDVKGMRTNIYKLKKKQIEFFYPIKISEI